MVVIGVCAVAGALTTTVSSHADGVRTRRVIVRIVPGSGATPESLLSTVETTPVALFVAVTVTPGTTAPEASATVPLIVPLLD